MAEKNKESKNMVLSAAKALIAAYIATAFIFVLCAAALTYTDTGEECVRVVSAVCTFLSAFISGFIISSAAEKRGMVWGIVGGAAYAAILMAVLFLSGRNMDFTSGKAVCLVLALIGGALGGIFGINRKK